MPTECAYDNTAIAVKKVVGRNERQLTLEFLRLESHFLKTQEYTMVLADEITPLEL